MKTPEISFFEWQKRFATDKACANFLAHQRWPNGFLCPRCGHDKAHRISTRGLYQCTSSRHQVSVTAGTLFHSTNLPLRKWFCELLERAPDQVACLTSVVTMHGGDGGIGVGFEPREEETAVVMDLGEEVEIVIAEIEEHQVSFSIHQFVPGYS